MSLGTVSATQAAALLDRIRRARVLVVGDVMLDEFIIGRVTRISPEAPVPVVQFERDEYRLGGAANVAHNAHALGARVALVGLVGRDTAGDRVAEALTAAGIAASGVVRDATRRTTTKRRIVTERKQQVARVDYEHDAEVAGEALDALVEAVTKASGDCDAIVASDYVKGCVCRELMARLVELARQHGVPLLVDPKIPHLEYYRGARLVTPNHHEAEIATHLPIRSDEDARAAARAFRERVACESVLITRGEHGMWLLDGAMEGPIPATAREVADVTGAGDTVIATLAVGLAVGSTLAEAAMLASHAAGLVVAKFGPATVTPDELLATF